MKGSSHEGLTPVLTAISAREALLQAPRSTEKFAMKTFVARLSQRVAVFSDDATTHGYIEARAHLGKMLYGLASTHDTIEEADIYAWQTFEAAAGALVEKSKGGRGYSKIGRVLRRVEELPLSGCLVCDALMSEMDNEFVKSGPASSYRSIVHDAMRARTVVAGMLYF